jgi:hypothetical protein
MKPTPIRRSLALALLATSALMTIPAATAAPPSDVADLVGARGAGGEQEMQSRGYAYVTMSHGTQYWWNAGRGACVGIKVANGRYQSVEAASASRCGQKAAPAGASRPSGNAESACMSGVNGKYDGNVRNVKVLSSEFSQANSVVVILAEGVRGGAANERWRCLVSNDGQVQELSVQR